VFRTRSGSGFNQVSGSGSGFGIRIRIQEGKITHKKRRKWRNFMFSFVGWRLLLLLGCPLWRPNDTWIVIFDQKNMKFFFNSTFFSNFWSFKPWIRIRIGIGTVFNQNAGSGSGINDFGSETLIKSLQNCALTPAYSTRYCSAFFLKFISF
jgi:hypothetical protein